VLKETKELIGTALVYYEEEVQCWEIGYNLGKKYWGKGYTTEAVKRVIEFARELGIMEIVGRYAKENPASGRVMEKLGFQYEKDIPYECNNGSVMREGVQCRLHMVKAVFLDFYGTVVHEDGEVIKKVSREIFDTGKVSDLGEIDAYWWNEFKAAFMASKGDTFQT
jgi:GNAT superfamily N-acetyltransferase